MYLYGIQANVLVPLQYQQALEHKIASANLLLTELLIPHYEVRDYERIIDVHHAIKFNESLLSELKEPNQWSFS